jgi:CRISPR system Cascade subunit CasE
MRLRFRLRANPVRTIHDKEHGRFLPEGRYAGELKRCRVPLLREEQQREWLQRKLAHAVRIDCVGMQQEMPLYFRKGERDKRMDGKVQPVLFDGLLSVSDADAFNALLSKGIGPAKVFGCGLLSIAPA